MELSALNDLLFTLFALGLVLQNLVGNKQPTVTGKRLIAHNVIEFLTLAIIAAFFAVEIMH